MRFFLRLEAVSKLYTNWQGLEFKYVMVLPTVPESIVIKMLIRAGAINENFEILNYTKLKELFEKPIERCVSENLS